MKIEDGIGKSFLISIKYSENVSIDFWVLLYRYLALFYSEVRRYLKRKIELFHYFNDIHFVEERIELLSLKSNFNYESTNIFTPIEIVNCKLYVCIYLQTILHSSSYTFSIISEIDSKFTSNVFSVKFSFTFQNQTSIHSF